MDANLEKLQQQANDDFQKKVQEGLAAIRKQAYEIEVKVEEGGKLPTKAHPSDAGYDLYSTEDVELFPGQVKKIPLNIRFKLPHGTWGKITTKSGLGSKGQLVYAGVIDQNYRGIVHVVMTNLWLIDKVDEEGFPLMRIEPIIIKKGEKIAQFIMNPYNDQYYLTQVNEMDMNTDRGAGGFGSTGKT